MKTIITATDFSPAAVNAANYSADLALACKADLLLLHVYEIPMLFLEVPLAATIEDMQRDAETELIKLKDALNLRTGNQIDISVNVRIGSFFTELQKFCDQVRPVYVVMGSQGSSAAERTIFGSHAVQAMKYLMRPLIMVPPAAVFSSVKRIGFAFDFHKVLDIMPVDEMKELVKDFNASLYLINTGPADAFNPEIIFGTRLMAEKLKPVKPNYGYITNEDTSAGVIEFAKKNAIDLLIVTPKQQGLLNRLIHKNQSKKLVLHSPVPVMALHH